MENYKKKLKSRRQICIVGILLLLAVLIGSMLILNGRIDGDETIQSFILGFQAGLSAALVGGMIVNIVKISKALKDDEKLKAMHIEENDERNAKIQKEVGASTSTIFMIVLMLATVISGYFSKDVFFALLATLIVYALIKVVCKLYFAKKY